MLFAVVVVLVVVSFIVVISVVLVSVSVDVPEAADIWLFNKSNKLDKSIVLFSLNFFKYST